MNKTITEIKEKIVPILKDFKVTRAGIFGSYARGEQRKSSDIDVLIEIDSEASLFRIIELKISLESKINKKFDLVEYSLIRKELKDRILSEEIPIIR